jgi:acetyl esterase
VKKLKLLEPFTRDWLQRALAAGGPALADLTPGQARQQMRDGQTSPHLSGIVHTEHQVSGHTVHVLHPEDAKLPLPGIVYLHGGGWVLGDFNTHSRLLGEIVKLTGAAIIFPEYDLAPEAPFPAALEQCYATLCWTAESANTLGIDAARLALAGDSSGGNLAAVTAMLAKQRRGPRIRLQALLCPVTDVIAGTRSERDFGDGFNLDLSVMEWFWDRYVPDPAARKTPLVSPLRARRTTLRGVAPALIITAECDVLRDQGEAYARKLADAGVPVAAQRCLGTVHSFLLENGLANSPPAHSAMLLLASHLKAAFREET